VDQSGAGAVLPRPDAQLASIARRFELSGDPVAIEPLGNGNVNDTWRVTVHPAAGVPQRLVLQRINPRVFTRPELVMANMQRLAAHLERPGALECASGRWEMPRILAVSGQQQPWLEHEGALWRLLTYIEDSRTLETIETPHQAREVGRALGTFHALIQALPAEDLADTLEGFHVTPGYLRQFERALRTTTVPLTPQVQHCIAFVRDREAFMPVLEDACQAGKLCLRPIHGDPKVNNILFDATSESAIALIDLDTVKPGLIHYDIGDCLRSGCNRQGEESEDWQSVRFDLQLCEAILQGYIAAARPFLTAADYDHIPEAIRLLSLELGLRFLSDHLAGDLYFRTSRPRHNLQRALVQFRLTESIETQLAQIRAIVERLRASGAGHG
jgi:Ser/Thr protein kinase RdoA (MazF antagonist)